VKQTGAVALGGANGHRDSLSLNPSHRSELFLFLLKKINWDKILVLLSPERHIK